MRAIRTRYKGIEFRSMLEAQWAKFFDAIKMPYSYEQEGYEFNDGTKYLPDFYLPDSDTFFEVKGIMSEVDMHKIDTLMAEGGKKVAIGYAGGRFQACNAWEEPLSSDALTTYAWLCRCRQCGKLYFIGCEGFWGCQCCGYYDGDAGFEVLMDSDGKGELNWNKMARLDYMKLK